MRGHCKKCGWPWHKWGNNVSDFCEHCFKDPRTEFTPLVLFDIEGRPEGCGKNIAVQFKKGCDPDRTDRGIREWVSVEKRFVDGIGIDRGMPGKVRKDLEAWHSPGTNGWILVGVIDRQGDLQQAFKEDEFLEMFEPVRYERFWRQGEDYEPVLKPGHHARIYPDRAGMTMEELETMVETMTAGSIGWGKTETVAQLLSNLMKHIKTI